MDLIPQESQQHWGENQCLTLSTDREFRRHYVSSGSKHPEPIDTAYMPQSFLFKWKFAVIIHF